MIDLRTGTTDNIPEIHRLILENEGRGHLLPRPLEEVSAHVGRFVVALNGGRLVGCADLAPLGSGVAEVRSLVVDETCRGMGVGKRLIEELAERARREGFATLCALTYEPKHFARLGFSIVPHVWLPEKIARDCQACALFRRCGKYAMVLALKPQSRQPEVRVLEAAPGVIVTSAAADRESVLVAQG